MKNAWMITGIMLAWAWPAWAQYNYTIALLSPTNNVTFPEADEFAGQVVGAPWKMQNLHYFPYDCNYNHPNLDPAGNWLGYMNQLTVQGVGGFYYPLFRGFSEPAYTNYFSWYDKGVPYGPLNPVDASYYTRLAVRQSLSHADRSFIYVFWYKTIGQNEDNHLGFIDADAAGISYPVWAYYADGFRLYDIDLTGLSFYTNRIDGINSTQDKSGTWSGTVYGFYVMPSLQAQAGASNQVDWLRLYHPSPNQALAITWETTLVPTNQASYNIQIYIDRDNQGYDGDLFLSGIWNHGHYELDTGALPPGEYYIYLKVVYAGSVDYYTVTQSQYSGQITIGARPSFEFTSPSYTSGVDYATARLGNPWDLSGIDDFETNRVADIAQYSFANGYFSAQTGGGDAQFGLNIMLNGARVPIDSTYYRYLTFHMLVDDSVFDILNRYARGTVARWQWAKSTFGQGGDDSYSKDIPLIEEWHAYTVDLWDNTFLETRGNFTAAQAGWYNVQEVNYLIFHPMESTNGAVFHVRDIRLCATPQSVNNQFQISWNAADADSTAVNVAFYYGTASALRRRGETPTFITTITNALAVKTYLWDTTDVPAGEYYLRADVSDGAHSFSAYSKAPVYIQSQSAVAMPVAGDYDGDQMADPGWFDGTYWYFWLSGQGYALHGPLSGMTKPGGYPVLGDFDVDGKMDPAMCVDGNWYIWMSRYDYSENGPYDLGIPNATPLAADFEGDRLAEPVMITAEGNWYVWLSTSGYLQSGPYAFSVANGVPVAGDFDRDGRADPAMVTDNYWYVWLSSGNYALTGPYGGMTVAGGLPLAADFDGDGGADPTIYLDGNWYVWLSSIGFARAGPYYFGF